jgi:mono/diheme cytochrome c family protein
MTLRRAVRGIAVTLASATALVAPFGERANDAAAAPSARGAVIFAKYCAVCHGESGAGDGRAASLQKVAPANLLLSTRSGEYQLRIVTDGGAALNRSSSMPAWRGELSEEQIQDVVAYIQRLSTPAAAHSEWCSRGA